MKSSWMRSIREEVWTLLADSAHNLNVGSCRTTLCRRSSAAKTIVVKEIP